MPLTDMKDVIDVMQLQREKSRKLPVVNYKELENNFVAVRYIFECGIKLDAQPLTIATAAILFHRFFKETDTTGYDSYLIAATTIYLAGKVKDDPLKIRDVINVTHNTLHRGCQPLELGDEYWNMRDAIVQAELLIMRMLKFEVTIVHPHRDFHFDPSIVDYTPQHIAIACINLALQCYGGQVPFTDEGEGGTTWYSVFCEDLQKDKLWEIMEKIIEVYGKEPDLVEK
ncbi:Cyclin-related protein FAM58B [Blattella germanica]|nr:Cyclin-related protein FAM58B [Blattella germanica]